MLAVGIHIVVEDQFYILIFAFINSTGPVSCSYQWIGDGHCDDQNNNADCSYDAGDCCGPNVLTNFCTECLCLNNVTTQTSTTANLTLSTTVSSGTTTAGIPKTPHLNEKFLSINSAYDFLECWDIIQPN